MKPAQAERILMARIKELESDLASAMMHLKMSSDTTQLVRGQRDAAYGMLRSVARAECMDEVRETVREFDDGYVGHG